MPPSLNTLPVAVLVVDDDDFATAVEIIEQLGAHFALEQTGDGWYTVTVVDAEDRSAALAAVEGVLDGINGRWREYVIAHQH